MTHFRMILNDLRISGMLDIIEACMGGGGGGYQYPLSLEENRKVSHIPLSKLENIPLIKFPKYPISLEVNKNIPEITNTK